MQEERQGGLGDDVRRGREEIRSLNEELAGIVADLRQLARSEAELARAEMRDSLASLKQSAVWGGVALVTAMLALTWVFLTLMFALDTVLPLWVASLVTLVVLGAVAGAAGTMAKARISQVSIVPKKTVSSVREDVQWARDQLRSQPTSSAGATR